MTPILALTIVGPWWFAVVMPLALACCAVLVWRADDGSGYDPIPDFFTGCFLPMALLLLAVILSLVLWLASAAFTLTGGTQ